MNITIASIGKFKSGPERALFEHYAGRLPWKITLKEFDVKKPLAPKERQAQEAEWLLAACKGCDYTVALHERGRELTSSELAQHIQKQRDNGSRQFAFIIGGADGLDAALLPKTSLQLSFGRITWPHLLVRGLLAEQLYRAHSILSGHPYHRE